MSVNAIKSNQGYLGSVPTNSTHEVIVIDGHAYRIHRVTVHRFTVGDSEDPELYAAEPLLQWQHSEQGQWVMDHAIETPMWHRHVDYHSYGHTFIITAKLKDRDYTFWTLKWNSR